MKFLLGLFLLIGCVSRQDVESDIYQNDGIPSSVCAAYPAVKKYGMFRVVSCKSKPGSAQCQHGETKFEEFRPYCSSRTKEYLSILNTDAEKWLSEFTKPKNQNP